MSTHEEADFRLLVLAKHAINSKTQTSLSWHWHRFNPPIWSSIVALVQEERYCKCQILRWRKTTKMHRSVFTPSPDVNTLLQVGKQWTVNLVWKKLCQDLVKMTQLMITFVEHLVNSFAQCIVVDVQKMSIPFDSTSSLRSRTGKINMWTCQPCRLAKPL